MLNVTPMTPHLVNFCARKLDSGQYSLESLGHTAQSSKFTLELYQHACEVQFTEVDCMSEAWWVSATLRLTFPKSPSRSSRKILQHFSNNSCLLYEHCAHKCL